MHRIHRPTLVLALLAATLITTVAGSQTPAIADGLSVDIVEPSLIPQTWGYNPDPITVHAGDTVYWTNTGIAPHSVTADNGSFDSGIMRSGQQWSLTTSTPGTFAYYCSLHPDMRSALIVLGE
jgi:plastocyanin